MNWTTAAKHYANNFSPLARIGSIKELCEAQVDMRSDDEYWTALRLDNKGRFQWGDLPSNPENISTQLVDTTKLKNRCYVIRRSAMKLLSRDCGSLYGALTSNDGEKELTYRHQRINIIFFLALGGGREWEFKDAEKYPR